MTWGLHDVSVELGGHLALADVSLRAEGGRIVAIVGGDGAGKTTALRVLAGRVLPGAGRVARPELAAIGNQPASSGVWRGLTVAENMAFVGRSYGLTEREIAQRGGELLERAGLAAVPDRLGGHLSGGMRQKLGFAMALLHRPQLMLLDEPTTGVDPVSRVELWQLISQSAADGAAVVLATTYLDEAERAQDVLVLDDGHPLASGAPDEILAAVPGQVTICDEVPPGAAGTWRRGVRRHAWFPPGSTPLGEGVDVDMEDAVIALTLARAATQRDARSATDADTDAAPAPAQAGRHD